MPPERGQRAHGARRTEQLAGTSVMLSISSSSISPEPAGLPPLLSTLSPTPWRKKPLRHCGSLTCSLEIRGGTHHCRGDECRPRDAGHRWRSWIQWCRRPTAPPRAAAERKGCMVGNSRTGEASTALHRVSASTGGRTGNITAGCKTAFFLKAQSQMDSASSKGTVQVHPFLPFTRGANGKYTVFPFLQRKALIPASYFQ